MIQAVIDLHCDLLIHMIDQPDPFDTKEIGCSFPDLKAGNVKMQVMAIFTPTCPKSTELAIKQSEIFASLLKDYSNDCYLIKDQESLSQIETSSKLGMIASIENASGFCEEDEPLEDGFKRLEQIISNVQRILYIGFTHHAENRFGGGNNSTVGLKEDGKKLLDYLNGRKIAVDFSHTSDTLARDILTYIDENKLDIAILASHSNYRPIWDHCRNLPDDLAKEVINRKGLIGLNFLRAFMNNDDPNAMYDHINHGLRLGGKNAICFGADYFNTSDHPDRSRVPFYFQDHGNASCYPSINANIKSKVSGEYVEAISNNNVLNFLNRLWKQ